MAEVIIPELLFGGFAGEAAVGGGIGAFAGGGAAAGGLGAGAGALAGGFGAAEALGAGAFGGFAAESAGFGAAEALGGFGGAEAFGGFGGAEALGGFGGAGEFAAGSEVLGGFGEFGSAEAGFGGADFASVGGFDEAGFGSVGGFDEAGFEEFGGMNDFAQADETGFGTSDGQYMSSDNADFGARDQLNQYQPGPENSAAPESAQATPARDAVDEAFNPNQTQAAPRGPGGGRVPAAAATARGGMGSFNPGSLLSSAMQLMGGQQRPSQLGSATGIAQQLADQGNLLLSNYNKGLLSGPMMAQLKAALQGDINKIKQFHAHNGTYNSTARIQAESQAYLKSTASMAQALQQELQQGLAFLGPAGNQFLQASQQTIAADNAYRSSLNSALGSILKIPFQGAGGQGQQQASAGYDDSGGSAYEGLEAA